MGDLLYLVFSRLFYISLVFIILLEMYRFFNSKRSFELYLLSRKDDKNTEFRTQPELVFYIIADSIYAMICLIGLFSSMRLFFLPLILLGLYTKPTRLLYKWDAFFCILYVVFLILNKFHFHWLI